MPLARQLVDQGFTILGPLVQKNDSLSFFTPEKDRIRTVSQRTKPNSRTTFIGEQPNPWNLLQLQDVMHVIPCFQGHRLYHHLATMKCKSLACYAQQKGAAHLVLSPRGGDFLSRYTVKKTYKACLVHSGLPRVSPGRKTFPPGNGVSHSGG